MNLKERKKRYMGEFGKSKGKVRWDDVIILQSQKIKYSKILQAEQEWEKGHMKTAILETS